MFKLWVASFNSHKIKEIKSLLPKGLECEILSARDLKFYSAPEETGKTFLENATIKAKSMRPLVPKTDWLIAEDSGLEVEALDGLPGIHSARYAGPKASDLMNNYKLLKMLDFKGQSSRNARYFCQLVALGPKDASSDPKDASSDPKDALGPKDASDPKDASSDPKDALDPKDAHQLRP